MDKIFDPEQYQMTICPVYGGYELMRSSDDVKVCPNCERIGFITEEGNRSD